MVLNFSCILWSAGEVCKPFSYEQSLLLLLLSRFSRVRLCATPWTAAYQAPLSLGLPRQEYWSGWPFPFPEDLPDPEIEPRSPALQADSLPLSHQGRPSWLLGAARTVTLPVHRLDGGHRALSSVLTSSVTPKLLCETGEPAARRR